MRSRAEVEGLTGRLIERSDADATEVIVIEQDESLTRFANSGIHQNVTERNVEVRVRVIRQGRTGVATTNQTSEEALDRVLREAGAIADVQPANPELGRLPGPAPLRTVSGFSDRTARFTPEERAEVVGRICARADRAGTRAFGAFSTGTSQLTVANSSGAFQLHTATSADLNAVVMGEDGAGYAARASIHVFHCRVNDRNARG